MRKSLSLLLLLLVLFLQPITAQTGSFAAPLAQTSTPAEKAQALLDTMTLEEKVGQLFLVSFPDQNVSPDSAIYDLIVNYHIGGVVLEAKNNNFVPGDETLPATLAMIQALQNAELTGSQQEIVDEVTLASHFPKYIPLFVGVSQNGDGYPYDQINGGLTELPNPMAIGATWNPELAKQVGVTSGQELSALGLNLLLGPSLDVLENPSPESLGDLGVRTFGGDPYWVGQMGSAFIQGVHEGSAGKIAVIAKNFPGYGGSDRPSQDEVATVRKSLEQLKQIELAAFFPVTGNAATPEAAADGLLLSHIRYQGLLGNIRFTTDPVSFDQQAFSTIFSLPEFSSWHDQGGLIITDDLSSRAVRRYYDPSNLNFQAWVVARDAFNAGSDLLFAGNVAVVEANDPDERPSIYRILDFFIQKYNQDLAFALRVDNSVLRILTLKFELYETFTSENVLPVEENLTTLGQDDAVTLEVARQGVTLLSPSRDELEIALPDAPNLNDRIIFVTDTSNFQQCPLCPPTAMLGPDTFEQTVLRLYGLDAGNQVIRQNLFSFTFDDLLTMLDNPDSYSEIELRIKSAQWLVFSMLDVRSDRPASQALRRLLSERDELLQGRKALVFAFNGPYYLDTTDISKLTAYFGMYSKSQQFVDTAARILFKEFTLPVGNSPVSVPGITYDLGKITKPDPNQTIRVYLDTPLSTEPTPTPTVEQEPIPNIEPTPLTNYRIGDVIGLHTAIIQDHYGHPVPDRTIVQFTFSRGGNPVSIETVQGVARTSYLINGGGLLEIRAISEDALQSVPLIIDVPGPEATLIPTLTPTPTPTETPTLNPTLEPTPVATPEPEVILHTRTDFVDWGLGVLVALAISLIAYRAGITFGLVRWSIRWALSAWIGGLLTYIYLSLDLPGSMTLLSEYGRAGIIWVISIGAGVGWVAGWVWQRVSRKETPRPMANPEASIPAKTRSG